MATLHISFIRLGRPFDGHDGEIVDILASANVTTSGANALSAAAPAQTTHAHVTSIDDSHHVTMGAAAPNATSDAVIVVVQGLNARVPCIAGQKIAAVTI